MTKAHLECRAPLRYSSEANPHLAQGVSTGAPSRNSGHNSCGKKGPCAVVEWFESVT